MTTQFKDDRDTMAWHDKNRFEPQIDCAEYPVISAYVSMQINISTVTHDVI